MQSGQEGEVPMHARRGCLAAVLTGTVILVGCTGGGAGPAEKSGSPGISSSGGSSSGAVLVMLIVHIGLFGGPARAGGGMALSNSPAQNENVTAVDAGNRNSVARTNADGVATLRLASGRYTVYSTYCGTSPHHVVLTIHAVSHVRIDCAVP
jgi:hypothetical protein